MKSNINLSIKRYKDLIKKIEKAFVLLNKIKEDIKSIKKMLKDL